MEDFNCMWFTIGEKIKVRNASNELKEYCAKRLILPNPDFYKKERMGKWTGGTPKNIVLYEQIGKDLLLPFGCLNDLWQSFKDKAVFDRDIPLLEARNYESRINLYPYQEKAVCEALKARNGVIVMPCGAGKTQTGLELAARIGGRTLWLTHTQDLLNQSMNRAKSVFDINPSTYGTITGGKVNIGVGMTFSTVQTMAKLDLSAYRNMFDVIIVDECHHAISAPARITQFGKVIGSLSCRFKYGLTATPKRADGLERSMFALLGDICAQVDKSAVKDTTCPVQVKTIETPYFPSMDVVLAGDGTLNYAALVEDMTKDEERFDFVLANLPRESGATLVLGNRVEYLQKLRQAYGGRSLCLSGMGNSKKAKAERKEALRRLNDGELDCVFCTYQLASEGLDVPNLRYVVFATPEKDPTRIQQASGRVGRKADGKEFGTVIDFADNFGLYRGWRKKRESIYKKLEYEVEA